MKKVIKNYLAKLQENEKKGFSLVELIIVMAIMAILVGVVASQVLPYMEKSRQSKDQQIISSLCTDITSAIAQSGESCDGNSGNPVELTDLASATNAKTVTELEGLRSGKTLASINSESSGALGSKLMKGGKIMVRVDNATGKIAVWVTAQDGKGHGDSSNPPSTGDKNLVENEQ